MAKPGATGLSRVINATGYSMKGLSSAWRHEAAFRQELLLMIVLTPLAFVVGKELLQTLFLLVLALTLIHK